MPVVDRRIRLDQADVARHGYAARPVEEGKTLLRLAERVGGEVGEHGHVAAIVDQPSHDRDAAVVGMRHHFVPILAEGADMLLAPGMVGDQ